MYKQLKKNEEKYLDEILEYILSTYNKHYAQSKYGIQTIDFLDSIGLGETTCITAIIQYISRYGKKAGYNREDLLKAAHYIVLLLHFHDKYHDTL